MAELLNNTHNNIHSSSTKGEDQTLFPLTSGIAWNLIEDAEKAQRWIQNAKLAIDVATASLEEVDKLVVDRTTHSDPATTSLSTIMEEQVDGTTLHQSALDIQTSVKETRQVLLEAKSKLERQSLKSTMELKDQMVELAIDLEEPLRRVVAKCQEREPLDPQRTSAPVDAEDVLKGEAVTIIDQASLNKIDGVEGCRRRRSSSASNRSGGKTKKESETLKACEVLKASGMVLADPKSLDKIDGIPARDQHCGVGAEEEERLATVSLDAEPKETLEAAHAFLKTNGGLHSMELSKDRMDALPERKHTMVSFAA